MSKAEICAVFQVMLREAYPRAIVKPGTDQWNPYNDTCYNAFFIPDSAAGKEDFDHWTKEDGWFERAEKLGLADVMIFPIYDSQLDERHLAAYPDLARSGKAVASSGQKKLKTNPKRTKAKSSPAHARHS